MSEPLALVWLRRDLRLHDHAALYYALQLSPQIQPIFIFDTDILDTFPNRNDRRLSFIAKTLADLNHQLQKKGGGLLIAYGKACDIIPRIVFALGASHVVAAEDYEPETIERDQTVIKSLAHTSQMMLVKDQVIFSPLEITRNEKDPYKKFTPYANKWRANLTSHATMPYRLSDRQRYADCEKTKKSCEEQGLTMLDASNATSMLAFIGYDEVEEPWWKVEVGQKRLKLFIAMKADHYGTQRNIMAQDGTSKLSPYLRFGLVSVRECVQAAIDIGADTWLSEFIWRDFYASILYHYPDSARTEWNPKYRARLNWSDDETHFTAWQQGLTGFPVIDAAMRQLIQEGWMHNRARMIVASFLTKNLRIDWRKGEAHFGRYLMDYDLASNVGGWQWAASTGTDAQPYFRIFNPITQSLKFDPQGDYIRRYVPELASLSAKEIHEPWKYKKTLSYPPPIIDLDDSRKQALVMFKSAAAANEI